MDIKSEIELEKKSAYEISEDVRQKCTDDTKYWVPYELVKHIIEGKRLRK